MQDIRFALRTLRKQPGFTAIAVLALAIGIGANTAIFSIVNAVVFRSLPYDRADELVVVLENNLRAGYSSMPVSPANYLDLGRSVSFQSIAAAEAWGATLSGVAAPERISGLRMTASIFPVLKARPLVGRAFTAEEEEPGRNNVVLLGYGLWQRSFGADPAVVGRTITLNGSSFQVIGVMPEGFRFPPFWASKAEMWTPLSFSPAQRASRGGKSLRAFARLRPGTTVTQAQAELSALAPSLVRAAPQENAGIGLSVTPLHEMVVGRVRRPLLVLLGAVGLVLLIACANVANLLLARSVARRREISVRMSLGATRLRLVRQMLTESVVLASLGGALGLAFAYFGLDALTNWFRASLPRYDLIRMDASVLLFTVNVSFLAALLFGLAPALQFSGKSLFETLKSSGRSVHGSRWTSAYRNALVSAQVAFALVLLIGAGLLARSFLAVQAIDPGFNPRHALTAVLNVAGTTVADPVRQLEFYRITRERLADIPGVQSVAAINHLPLAGDAWGTAVFTEDNPNPAPGEVFRSVFRVVSPGYFRTMQIPLRGGRDFAGSDAKESQPAAVISDIMAKQLWPGQNAVGKRLRFGPDQPWHTVIGVVGAVKQQQWMADPEPELYLAYWQHPEVFRNSFASSMSFVLRSSGDENLLARAVEEAVHSIYPGVPVSEVQSFESIVADATIHSRMYAMLLGLFAASALLLACIGIYGVISYTVSQRIKEMGIRMALGATKANLLRLVLGDALLLVSIGGVTGILVSLAVSRFLASLLYGVKPDDIITFCGVCALLLAAALVAAYIPARRAAGLDPAMALRNE